MNANVESPGTSARAILAYMTPKQQTQALEAFELLELSEAQSFWLPKASRRCRSAFTKLSVAARWAEKRLRTRLSLESEQRMLEDAILIMSYGSWHAVRHFERYSSVLAWTPSAEIIYKEALRVQQPLFALAQRMDALDARRPKPELTYIGTSRTITATIEGLDVAPGKDRDETPPLALGAVRTEWPEFRWSQVEVVDPKKGRVFVWYLEIVWPEGTLHGTSRFSQYDDQCESCGHRIRNPHNWFPVCVRVNNGPPRSLWVGVDCAERVFGIKIKAPDGITLAPGSRSRPERSAV